MFRVSIVLQFCVLYLVVVLCVERLVDKTTHYMSIEMLTPTHSLMFVDTSRLKK